MHPSRRCLLACALLALAATAGAQSAPAAPQSAPAGSQPPPRDPTDDPALHAAGKFTLPAAEGGQGKGASVDAPGSGPVPAQESGNPDSPWYLERGTSVRPALPTDDIPEVALLLARELRDGGIPGFFDGQFKSTADRFDELAALAAEPSMNHVLRVMAVMALQEAGTGEKVAAALEPLLLTPEREFGIDHDANINRVGTDDPRDVTLLQIADLSEHARFALAKDGQPEAVLAKIRIMDHYVDHDPKLLDPSYSSQESLKINYGRQVIFDIGYHYQQFDDYVHAREWFHKLCDNLPGMRETRWAHYNLACIAALSGHPEEALDELRAAYEAGFTDVGWLSQDGDLKSLRDRPDFQALVASMRNLDAPPEPPRRSLLDALRGEPPEDSGARLMPAGGGDH
ncbi:MAG TPA: hypothetical protein VK824_02865 [Planctomycetota bacterium]|nr:hypothetical protein [Planctomycetota bacterium]